jgi:hypothetical protein
LDTWQAFGVHYLERRVNCNAEPRLAFLLPARVPIYIQHMGDRYRFGIDKAVRGESPHGITAIGIFLFFGAIMASLAGTALIWPGTVLDKIWALNATAYKQLAPFGRTVGILFLLLSTALAVAGTGWFRRRLWGWRLAVVIIATQAVGDLVNFVRGDFVRGGIGLTIAGTLLFYLLRPEVKAVFERCKVSRVR